MIGARKSLGDDVHSDIVISRVFRLMIGPSCVSFFFFVNVFASSTVRLHMHLHAEESQSTDQKRYPGFAF